MRAVRYWSVSNAGLLEKLYSAFEWCLIKCHPLFKRVGYARLEKPVAFIEEAIKGFLFDCKMCGQCALSSTGMSCSMNCPKNIRNGPCGGVRANGHCEVIPNMRCVWVEAVRGSRKMGEGKLINVVQLPVDYRLKGKSSWLIVAREKGEATVEAN
jgi:hypothetical protein